MKVKELKLEDVEVPPSWGHRQKHRQCILKELAWFAYKVSGLVIDSVRSWLRGSFTLTQTWC